MAALHAPHKPLAVPLQFVGRLARTAGDKAGTATLLAVPSDIEIEAEKFYRVGAEWDELIEGATRRRLQVERGSRELMEGYKRTSFFADEFSS